MSCSLDSRRLEARSLSLIITKYSNSIIFSGETDQETLRNIASAPLDFPAELFEGVSDEAKEFIKDCLSRNPK